MGAYIHGSWVLPEGLRSADIICPLHGEGQVEVWSHNVEGERVLRAFDADSEWRCRLAESVDLDPGVVGHLSIAVHLDCVVEVAYKGFARSSDRGETLRALLSEAVANA